MSAEPVSDAALAPATLAGLLEASADTILGRDAGARRRRFVAPG
jgi:hypothetical protein